LANHTTGRTCGVLSEIRVLRRIFGPNLDEVTEGWRKYNFEELHNYALCQMVLGSSNKGG
jgi:hypothetical protein